LAYGEAVATSEVAVPEKKKVLVLGTGWAGTSFLRNLNDPRYEVHVVSPRNYFAFTPLLPSVTCGTVEARSIVEPVRNIFRKVGNLMIITFSSLLHYYYEVVHFVSLACDIAGYIQYINFKSFVCDVIYNNKSLLTVNHKLLG
jgi:hypothetical protein